MNYIYVFRRSFEVIFLLLRLPLFPTIILVIPPLHFSTIMECLLRPHLQLLLQPLEASKTTSKSVKMVVSAAATAVEAASGARSQRGVPTPKGPGGEGWCVKGADNAIFSASGVVGC